MTENRERVDPPLDGDENGVLLGFLDYHRQTLRQKTDGLDGTQLAQRLPSSEMTLGGMLKHVAFVEDWWFGCVLLGEEYPPPWDAVDWEDDWDWDWHSAAEDSPDELRAQWRTSVARAEKIVADVVATDGNLNRVSVHRSRSGERFNLRWIVVHMIEEYARHNGHADLLREAIDGETGE